jgi:FkbM family methyltransferase
MAARGAPLLFRLSRALTRRGTRGGYRLQELSRRLGARDRIARYPITAGVSLDVPIGRPENAWDRGDVMRYQRELIDDLVRVVEAQPAPATLLDCGADIGLVSVLVAARCGDRLERIVAIEPNPVAHEVLEGNLGRLPVSTRVVRAAAADFSGSGTLTSPDYDGSDHARFLVVEPGGEIPVVRIDDLGLGEGVPLVIKLDVEGGELQALEGARGTLERSAGFAVSFEAHPAVTERTGVDPGVIVRFLDGIRPCEVTLSEFPDFAFDRERPFFSQFRPPRQIGYSLLCRSR